MNPSPLPPLKLGQLVYFTNLFLTDGGTVQHCKIKQLEIVMVPNVRNIAPSYRCLDVEGRSAFYHREALHTTFEEAQIILKARLKGRIRKLQKALGDVDKIDKILS